MNVTHVKRSWALNRSGRVMTVELAGVSWLRPKGISHEDLLTPRRRGRVCRRVCARCGAERLSLRPAPRLSASRLWLRPAGLLPIPDNAVSDDAEPDRAPHRFAARPALSG